MMDMQLHRRALIMAAVAVSLLALGLPMLGKAREMALRHTQQLAAESAKTAAAAQQLEINIAAAHELAGRIAPEEVERLLAPVDRMQAAGLLDRQAAQHHLTHFAYTLGAERKDFAPVTGEAATGLVTSRVDLTAEAPSDTDVYAFLDSLRHELPGRLRLTQLSLQRLGTSDAEPAADNLRMEAHLDWLSNSAKRSLAGAP